MSRNMAQLLFILSISISLIGRHHVNGQSTCCEGIKMPELDCLLSWDSFVEYVADFTWLGIYGTFLDPTGVFSVLPQKPILRWGLLPEYGVRGISAFGDGSQETCAYQNATISGGACSGVGKLEYSEGGTTGLNRIGRVSRFSSPNPDKFVLYSACMDERSMCDGLCRDGFVGVIIKDQRINNTGDIILNEIPWCQIEETLNECVNVSLYDDSYSRVLEWLWTGTDGGFGSAACCRYDTNVTGGKGRNTYRTEQRKYNRAQLLFILTISISLIGRQYVDGQSTCCEGIKMPELDCLLPWDSFVQYVADTTWLGIYGRFLDPTGIFSVKPLKPVLRWELLPEYGVRRLLAYRVGNQETCGYQNFTSSGGACSRVAKLEYSEGDTTGLHRIGRVDRFVSPNPEKFVVYSGCLDQRSMCDGLCRDGFIAVVIKDQRINNTGDIILNEIPWCQVEVTLNECFNVSLYDDSYSQVLDWLWTGTECNINI